MCVYLARPSKQDRFPELQPYKHCASVINGILKINPKHMRRIDFSSDQIAGFFAAGQMFYVKPDGRFLPVVKFDNGPDVFSEGLVRSLVNGKMAYYDRQFNLVLATRFDWGWPFEHGRALVCIGCVTQAPDGEGHKLVEGGLWGYINHQGKEVIPVIYSREEVYDK